MDSVHRIYHLIWSDLAVLSVRIRRFAWQTEQADDGGAIYDCIALFIIRTIICHKGPCLLQDRSWNFYIWVS